MKATCYLFMLKLEHRGMPLIFSQHDVYDESSLCLAGLPGALRERGLFMPLWEWRGHTALHPSCPSPSSESASGSVPWTVWLDSPVVKLQHRVDSKIPDILQNRAVGPGTVICHFTFFLWKEVNEFGKQEGKVDGLDSTLNNSTDLISLSLNTCHP